MFALSDFTQSLILYIKLYLSIYSLPLLLFKTKSLLVHTADALKNLLVNSFVSALFLAVDGSVVKYSLCLFRNLWGGAHPLPYVFSLVAGFLGVSGLLIERQSRRLELLYYVLPQVSRVYSASATITVCMYVLNNTLVARKFHSFVCMSNTYDFCIGKQI